MSNKIQKRIGEILDVYKLKNVRALEDKITELKRNDGENKELKLLEFVVEVYEQDCAEPEVC
jgi:hypothetical protein